MVKRKLVKMAEDSSKLVSYYRELNYAELYNELVTEITELPLLFLRLKSACRLVEAEKRNIKSLDDVYSELDTTFQSITVILGELRKKEKDVIYVEGHVIPQTTINNSEGFAHFYIQRRNEASSSIYDSRNTLTQLREKVINRIPTIVQRNIEIRKWSEYSNDLNDLEKSLIEINEKIVDYANRIDKKFGTSMIEIINQEGK